MTVIKNNHRDTPPAWWYSKWRDAFERLSPISLSVMMKTVWPLAKAHYAEGITPDVSGMACAMVAKA